MIGMMRVILRGTFPVLALALAGCAGMWFAEREPWRRDAEVACLQSGAVKEGPTVTIVKAINGPGLCGADHPLQVAAIGGSARLGSAVAPWARPGDVRPRYGLRTSGRTPAAGFQ